VRKTSTDNIGEIRATDPHIIDGDVENKRDRLDAVGEVVKANRRDVEERKAAPEMGRIPLRRSTARVPLTMQDRRSLLRVDSVGPLLSPKRLRGLIDPTKDPLDKRTPISRVVISGRERTRKQIETIVRGAPGSEARDEPIQTPPSLLEESAALISYRGVGAHQPISRLRQERG